MRVPVLALLLLTAGLVGCLADEGPERSIEPSSEQPGEDDDPDPPAEGEDEASEDEEEEADERGSEANRSAREAEEDEPPAANDSVDPQPFELGASLPLGYLAAVGTTWLGGPEDVGAEDTDHCPVAELLVPAGSQRLTVSVDGDPAGPPSNATSPSAGAYTIHIESPEGQSVALDWASTLIDGQDALRWTSEAPAEGAWAIEARPEGPVVQQTWRVDAHVAGQAPAPPDQLAFATTC